MKNAINLKRTCKVLESFVKFLLICACLSLIVEGKTVLIISNMGLYNFVGSLNSGLKYLKFPLNISNQ